MITKTEFMVPDSDVQNALDFRQDIEVGRIALNQPTGRFFYDSWEIKPEYKGTPWEVLLDTLGVEHGEARLITMPSKTSYVSHADLDDRYHLNLSGVLCYLIDLDTEVMHLTEQDSIWYEMDASKRHSAVNFGNRYRQQLVVRKLLSMNVLTNPVKVRIVPKINDLEEARFIFDNSLSPILNIANKQGNLSDFKIHNQLPEFACESSFLTVIVESLPSELHISYPD